MGKIRLDESILKKIIAESIRKVMLNEAIDIAKGVPEKYRKAYLEKMIREYPDLDPDGFFWLKDTLKHNGKKKRKSTPKEKLPSREESGLEPWDYLKQIVIKNDPNLENTMAENGEKWENLSYTALRGNGVDADYSNDYYISNMGRVLVVNANNGKGKITLGYWDGTSSSPQYRINLRTYNSAGEEMTHNTPSIAKLVAIAFLHPQGKCRIVFKDGNPQHPYANNLEIVPIR
jgi:hypothetical protein